MTNPILENIPVLIIFLLSLDMVSSKVISPLPLWERVRVRGVFWIFPEYFCYD
jgi:hypothetical protein